MIDTTSFETNASVISNKRPPGGVCFFLKFAISAGVRPAAVTIGRQQLKILLIGRAPSCFKYNLKANGVRRIIFGVIEFKTPSDGHRPDAGLFFFFGSGNCF